ncbi:GyrI-like domain-containing protein [candidate division KSB1 bacterium]|nr:GyrI-like domain-containing protein [candidate division KSB1 bacterium]
MKHVSLFAFLILFLIISTIPAWAQDEDLETPSNTEESLIQVKEIAPYSYCAIVMTGSYDKHSEAFQTLYEQAQYQYIDADQIPFGIYWNDPSNVPIEELSWELGFAVPDTQKVEEPLVLKKWNFPLVVSRVYEGAYDDNMNAVYGEIFGWIGQNNYVPAGPMQQKFLTLPQQDDEGHWGGTIEIIIPVEKAEK